MDWAGDVLEHRRRQPDLQELVGLRCRRPQACPELDSSVREFIAWRYVYENAEPQAGRSADFAGQNADGTRQRDSGYALLDTFVWGLYPKQSSGEPTYTVGTSSTSRSTTDLIGRTAAKLEDQIATARSAALIRMDLDGPSTAAWESGALSAGQLHFLLRDVSLPHPSSRPRDLVRRAALRRRRCFGRDGFAFADGYDDGENRYRTATAHRRRGSARRRFNANRQAAGRPSPARGRDKGLSRRSPRRGQNPTRLLRHPVPNTRTTSTENPVLRLRDTQPRSAGKGIQQDPRRSAAALVNVWRNRPYHLGDRGIHPRRLHRNVVRTVRENGSTLRFTTNEFE